MPKLRSVALGGVLAVVTGLVPGVVLAPTPSEAMSHTAVTIGEGESFEVSYPRIVGNNPAGLGHRPDACTASVYCDVVRLTIKPPTSDPTASYFVRIRMSWLTRAQTPAPLLGEVTNNDMDMYVYDVPFVPPPTGEDDEYAATGATGAQPEHAYLDRADDYDVVIVNFYGANEEGYRLGFTYVMETDFTPFESLDDGVRPVIDTSGDPVPAPAAPSLPGIGSSPFIQPPVDLNPLTNFDDPFGLGRPISSVAQAGDILRRADEARAIAAAKPVSAATAIFWLVVFPLLLVGLAGAFFMRRRSTALRLDA
ncbi:MAG TPA: hypothetical protein VM938_12485 [Acidimicrobiales bacterium]|nr:hypothetical protein [Acidimicrobiales bacterium]